MSDASNTPPPRWSLPRWLLPVIGFALITSMSVLLLAQVKDAFPFSAPTNPVVTGCAITDDTPQSRDGDEPPAPSIANFVSIADWGLPDRARFAQASLIWAALGAAILTVLTSTLLFAVGVIYLEASGSWLRLALLYGWIILFGGAMLVNEIVDDDSLSATLTNLSGEGQPFKWGVRCFAIAANTLTAGVVAALFAAACAVLVSLDRDPHRADVLWGRLRGLLSLGAIATVLGVLEIGALGSMTAAAITGPAADAALNAGLEERLSARLDEEVTALTRPRSSDNDVSAPLLDAWAKQWAPKGAEKELGPVAADVAATRLKGDPHGAGDLRRAIIGVALGKQRTVVAEAIEQVSAHRAAFWGLMFSVALALLYLPPSFAVVHAGRDCGAISAAQSGSAWERVIAPLGRILLALAPLLVGASTELLQTLPRVFGP